MPPSEPPPRPGSKVLLRGLGPKYRCVLVEDEEHSRARLRRLLEAFPDDVEIVGEAADGPSAVETIQRTRPDLLFLDIDLPGFGGFEVLDRLEQQPAVIFTTAFNEHAIKAFSAFTIAYLVKPFDVDAIAHALEKLRAMGFDHKALALALRELLDNSESRYLTRISCKVGDRTVLVKTDEILFFRAEHKYTTVQTPASEYLIDISIVELVGKLNPREFIQVHRGTLVNVSFIAGLRRLADGKQLVILKDEKATELAVGRHFANSLKTL